MLTRTMLRSTVVKKYTRLLRSSVVKKTLGDQLLCNSLREMSSRQPLVIEPISMCSVEKAALAWREMQLPQDM